MSHLLRACGVPVGHGEHALLEDAPDEEGGDEPRGAEGEGAQDVGLAAEPWGHPLGGGLARREHLLLKGKRDECMSAWIGWLCHAGVSY